jgi:L-threonylcarbamoyladenylate synthase
LKRVFVDTTLTADPTVAARVIREGRLAAFPTETVYGLGADASEAAAVERIFEAKERPADNPLIVHVHDRSQIEEVAESVPSVAQTLLDAFAPGPITLILPKGDALPSVVTAGLDTVGVRVPRLGRTRTFLAACDTPVAAPSANRSGRPSPTSWEAVQADLDGRIACILQGGRTEAGVESTVVDCTTSPPAVLRPGAISIEALRGVVWAVAEADGDAGVEPKSPGTKHRNYAPAAPFQLVDRPPSEVEQEDVGYIGLEAPEAPDHFRLVCVAADVEEYAHEVFHFFRRCDERGCSVILAQTVPPRGMGRALNDRLRRAAAR